MICYSLMPFFLLSGFLLGALVSLRFPRCLPGIFHFKNTKEKPVYMIINGRLHVKEKLKAYHKVAVPHAEKAGLKPLDYSKPLVLQGEWPYEGGVVVEEFRSMDALKKYWYSKEYQEARKLLVGADTRDFTIIVGDEE